jgi:hypothetical protein
MHIQKLINIIRRFTTTSVAYGGAKYLWDFNKGEIKLDEKSQTLLAYYGRKIIVLGLLETSNFILLTHNNKSICYSDNFIELCEQYLEAFSDSQYGWNRDPQDHIDALTAHKSQKDKGIPNEYLQEEMKSIIVNACKLNALMQLQNSQTYKKEAMRVTQTYMAIVTELENQNVGDIDIINKIKDVEPIKFLRSGWALCAIASQRGGIIDFSKIPPKDFKFKDVDKAYCLKVAHKLSEKGNLNNLKEEWKQRSSGLITQNTNQELISFLENIPPIICTELANGEDTFIIPCPIAYRESLGTPLLDKLASSMIGKKMRSKIGEAIESHIKMALEHIFGKENVTKIPKDSNADFHIKLDDYDLIIEVKRSIGYAKTIKDTANTWHRLNKAYIQCANSIKEYKTGTKPIIAIIIIFEEAGLTPASFQVFAEQSKLANDLEIEYIKIMSWYDLESILSRTSVSQFIATLLKHKDRYDDLSAEMTVAEAIYHPEFPNDVPAHNYEYLQEAKNRLDLSTL